MNQLAVQVSDLRCERGGELIFDKVNFSLKTGECLQVVGANGAGKTGLLRLLAGLLFFEQGSIKIPQAKLFLSHEMGIKKYLTPIEHLQVITTLYSLSVKNYFSVLQKIGLTGCENKSNGQLSMGQQRRLALASLLLVPASLWLLDEPLSYLDQAGQQLLPELIQQHLDKGGLCIFSSHQPVTLPNITLQTLNLSSQSKVVKIN